MPRPLPQPLLPGDYYYTPDGYMVFTEQYHRRRGYCCGSGCRHCPWKKKVSPPESNESGLA
ncbi:DUF5522 domain-containing protein [Hymenobacter metallilatus]|uniref:DUF5522 domain-containing protein n=1 Tax=Hymenobacter metallilatus TaxID=2493666 RepID=UPI0029394549|nr:DUF5522 domain-containing protein [Hymenobacter metallilatus]